MYEISRREMILSSAAATALFGLSGRVAFVGVAEAQQKAMEQGFSRHRIGSIEVTGIYDGVWEKPQDPSFIANATVDQTKAALAAAGLPTEFVPIPFTANLVKTGDRVALIDSGTGSGQTGGPKAGKFLQNLAAAGAGPADIQTVVISHFHPDHIFGLMTKAPENRPVFANAYILVPDTEFNFWMDPAIEKLPKERRPLAKRIQEMFPLMKGRLHTFADGTEVLPGIRAVQTPGHTPGHTSFHVASDKDQLLVLGDISNLPALFVKHPEWHCVFDQDATMAEATRRKVFDRVVADKVAVTGYHFPFPAAGMIMKDGSGYTFVPA